MKNLFAAALFALLSSCSSSTDKPVDEKKLAALTPPADQPAGAGGILRLDPGFDSLVPSGAKIEKIARMTMIALPSGVAFSQMNGKSDLAKK